MLDRTRFMTVKATRNKSERTAAARNREWMRKAAKEGFRPMTREDIASLALGTPEEGEALRRASAELKVLGKKKRKRA